MRTDAELLEFALTCEKIEKQGGDVLGYIEQEYPSYTPRATWYRLQKNQLKRTEGQLTEGRPKEEGVKYVGRMMELAKGCLEAYGRGERVYDYLEKQGSANPSAYWYQIKQTVKLKDPDLYELLSVIRTDTRKKPSPTCCQPARESGVEVPDEITAPQKTAKTPKQNGMKQDIFRIVALDSDFGRYALTAKGDITFVRHDSTQTITLSHEDWMQFLAESGTAIKKLQPLV